MLLQCSTVCSIPTSLSTITHVTPVLRSLLHTYLISYPTYLDTTSSLCTCVPKALPPLRYIKPTSSVEQKEPLLPALSTFPPVFPPSYYSTLPSSYSTLYSWLHFYALACIYCLPVPICQLLSCLCPLTFW